MVLTFRPFFVWHPDHSPCTYVEAQKLSLRTSTTLPNKVTRFLSHLMFLMCGLLAHIVINYRVTPSEWENTGIGSLNKGRSLIKAPQEKSLVALEDNYLPTMATKARWEGEGIGKALVEANRIGTAGKQASFNVFTPILAGLTMDPIRAPVTPFVHFLSLLIWWRTLEKIRPRQTFCMHDLHCQQNSFLYQNIPLLNL